MSRHDDMADPDSARRIRVNNALTEIAAFAETMDNHANALGQDEPGLARQCADLAQKAYEVLYGQTGTPPGGHDA